MLLLLLAAGLAALVVAGPASARRERKLEGNDSGKTVRLRKGDILRVTLKENASTGYRWRLVRKPRRKLLRLASNRYKPAPQTDPPTTGAAGHRIFRWRARRRGKTALKIQFFPPAPDNARAEDTFLLTVVVR